MITRLLVLALLVSLGACAWRDRANDYRYAQLSESLELPPGVESESMRDSYRVPGIESHAVLPGNFKVPQPDPLVKDEALGTVRIQKMGDERWVLLEGTPGQIWPRLRGFLNLGGFPVARTDAVNGLIDTAWVQPEGDLPRERYRFRVEQGVQRGTSEIYVLQSSVEGKVDDWPRDSFSEEREQKMTMALAQYLADTEAASSVSMLAQRNVEAGGKVFLVKDAGATPFIRLLLPFDRAWAALAIALEKSGFSIEDRDRSQGRYWVKIGKDESSTRWFLRLTDDRDDAADAYYVELDAVGEEEMQIRVLSRDESKIEPVVLDRILKQIKGFMA